MAKICIVHGPNLNQLGQREPAIYGMDSLESINQRLRQQAQALGHHLHCIQSNHEGVLIDEIQAGYQVFDYFIVNLAGFTHTSVALRDALLAVDCPFIEVHLSQLAARESFRQHSMISDVASGVIYGLGAYGYELALLAAHHALQNNDAKEQIRQSTNLIEEGK